MKTGKVWLVGAGPGDIGLFTLKGLKVLEQADVVVYDSLVGQGVLSRIPENARLINVGKRASHHIMRQENINQVLLEEAQRGLRVVRLKGGDPFLFGRGGEELELLRENGIPYEVVPGVTSSIAVPAYNGVPVTHRDFCSSVHIITGHKRAGEEYDIDFRALVDTKGTLVFLMGVSALPDICEGLIGAGMEKDMPAAILQKGTTAGQKRIVATVSTLEEEVKRQGIETPAMWWVRCVHWQRSLTGMKNCRFQDGKSLSQDRKSLFPELRTSFVKKERRFWNFQRSVRFLWKTRAAFIRQWISLKPISGLYLPALQE